MVTQERAIKAIQCAIKHLGQGSMVESARLSLHDAVHNLERGAYEYAWQRAIASIAYSVGFLHESYTQAKAAWIA